MFTTWFVENLSSIKQQIIMVTLNFKILPNRRKASNKLGIYLAVSHKKETRYITTEFEIDDTWKSRRCLPSGASNCGFSIWTEIHK